MAKKVSVSRHIWVAKGTVKICLDSIRRLIVVVFIVVVRFYRHRRRCYCRCRCRRRRCCCCRRRRLRCRFHHRHYRLASLCERERLYPHLLQVR
uniref:Uncharacterized protein n=1 Tax=Loa loa TaxID=7209 RepID=A0A1I7V952_LOALO